MTGAGERVAVTSLSRHWNIGLNLYALSDGRFWLDDVGNDRQGFVTSAQADGVRRHTVRNYEYEAESLDAMLAVYAGNTGRSIEELTSTYSHPGPLYSEPGRPFHLAGDEHARAAP